MNKTALTYDDIQLVPNFSNIKSRTSISLITRLSQNYNLIIPIIASPMDTICEINMAVEMFKLGGVGCIHRFNTPEEQAKMIADVKYKIYDNWHLMQFLGWEREDAVPIMAAIGVSESDKSRAKLLVESGANVLLIDVAHGDHQNVIDMIYWCKKHLPSTVDIIAGNIATASAAERLQEAGADGLRVGIGGGSVCSTRIKTGFGIPNVTCIKDIVNVAKVPVIADGGIRTSGDIAKALGLGSSTVMLGSLIAGTYESPGDTIIKNNSFYKKYRGSASVETKLANGQENRNIEGESTLIPYKGEVKDIIKDLSEGIKSALSYAGANDLSQFYPNYVIITSAGINEAKPHIL